MNAKVSTMRHYADVEATARDAARAREVIQELRTEIHSVIADLNNIVLAYGCELRAFDALISRAHKTLLRTLPGGELDLDAMSKPKRRETLFDVISNIALPPVHRSNCDVCDERPWTHRHDTSGIETYVCDVCSP